MIQSLKLIREQEEFESYLIMTDSAKLTLEHETKITVEEVEQMAAKLLEPFGIEAKEYRRWNGL